MSNTCHPKSRPPSRPPSINLDFIETRRIARAFGFVGRVEYRHVFSGSGGAQFGLASEREQDALVIDAEAFLRDADPDDFSLEAMIAHERGHQIVCRNEQLQAFLGGKVAPAAEEILASLAGSWLVADDRDRQSLVLKALDESVTMRVDDTRSNGAHYGASRFHGACSMIGRKKLGEIRANVAKACAKAGVDPAVWIEEEINKANRAKARNKAEIQTLKLVRDGLRNAAAQKRRGRAHSK